MFFKKYLSKFLMLSSLILILITTIFLIDAEASTGTYDVYYLKVVNGKVEFGDIIASKSSFDEAKKIILEDPNGVIVSEKSKSPLKIVAATRGQAQSYPYRKGKRDAEVILNIYTDKGLTNALTYIPAHYLMYVYDYELYVGRIIANVEIQGGRGYVEVDKVDIIPMIYIENGMRILIGGNENYYSKPEQPYEIVPVQESYTVSKNELTVRVVRPHPNLSNFSLTYGIAPDGLKEGVTYYSPDGINFYKDRELKEKVVGNYYAYFQWLPVRSMTNHSSKVFDAYLHGVVNGRKSVLTGETYNFIEQGLIYGMNPLLIFQQANLESAHGMSKYALDRYNIFGWGAADSNPDLAEKYGAVGVGVRQHMRTQLAGYMDVNDLRHYGPSFGNKGSGITVKYASDPYYGIKIASMAYRLDKANGYKDHNAYNLSLMKDNTTYSVKRNSTTNVL